MKRTHYKKRNIFPADWAGQRPYDTVGEADVYYASLASRVLVILRGSYVVEEIFSSDDDARRAAITLTSLFEDIISGTGVWEMAIREFILRHGVVLPFYDTSDYVRGEINVQDVQLLLWDICQGYRKSSVLNPENPHLARLSSEVYAVFDEEYETAPENVRLREFLLGMGTVDKYWEVRKRLEWILNSCFLNHRFITEMPAVLDNIMSSDVSDGMGLDKMVYLHQVESLYGYRSNLVSFRSAEILSAVCGRDPDGIIAAMRLSPMLNYRYLGCDDDSITVERMADGKEFKIELDSFNDDLDLSSFREGTSSIACQLVNFGDKWYQCGLMGISPDGVRYSEKNREEDLCTLSHGFSKEFAAKARKLMNGRNWLVFPSFDGVNKLMEKIAPLAPGQKADLPRNKDYLVCLDVDKGLCVVGGLNHCICSPDNPYYNKERAERDALVFFCDPDACSYECSCLLQDEGLLPDARLKSIKGEAYGQAFLHRNGAFFTDYFYHRYRGDGA